MPVDALVLNSSHLLDELIDEWESGADLAVTDTLRQSDDHSLEDIHR
jgi:hypothetical protein